MTQIYKHYSLKFYNTKIKIYINFTDSNQQQPNRNKESNDTPRRKKEKSTQIWTKVSACCCPFQKKLITGIFHPKSKNSTFLQWTPTNDIRHSYYFMFPFLPFTSRSPIVYTAQWTPSQKSEGEHFWLSNWVVVSNLSAVSLNST